MFSIRHWHTLRPLPIHCIHSYRPRYISCPSCLRPLPSFLPACTNCWHISGLPQDTKFHDIFGLPYEPNPFNIDLPTLKQRFRDAQALCHPDGWASKGSNKQDVAQALSARINNAYQRLLNPLSRAEYILERQRIPISEADRIDDIEFMSEIMLARETIEEAEDTNEVAYLLSRNAAEIKDTTEVLGESIGNGQWEDVKSAVVRLRYLQGIEQAAKKWLDNR